MSEHPSNPAMVPSNRGGGIQRADRAAPAPVNVAPRVVENGVDIPALILDMAGYQTAQCAGHPFTRAVNPDMVRQIGNLLTVVRWPYITNTETALKVWNETISGDPGLLEYVLRLTQQVTFHLHGWGLIDEALSLLSTVLGRPEGSLYHHQLSQRLSSASEVKKLMVENPWLLTMQLAAMSDGAARLGRLAEGKSAAADGLHLEPSEADRRS